MPANLAPTPPHITGPVWQKTEDGGWRLPEKTLGWDCLNWLADYIKSPGGEYAGEAFMPTDEQARFLLWWYAVDEGGNYLHSDGVLRRLKGWGKDPLAAAMALLELCGPVAFSHFDTNGDAVGKPRHAAWIQVAAVSQDQTKNTFGLFPIMVSKALKQEYGLEVNKTVIYSAAGGKIESVTSSPASMEGNRPTFVIQNETQWWGCGPDHKINEGHSMADVIEGNVTKIPGARKLSICNAHIPGLDTVAEKDYDAYQDIQSGKAVDTGMLYDALEAPADTPVSEIPSEKEDPEGYRNGVQKLREGIELARGDSVWLPVEEIVQSVLNVRNAVTESRRKFLNQVNAHEDSWISPQEWDKLALTEPLFKLKPGERVTLGFDGSKSNDWTALVACRVSDGCLFLLKSWNPDIYITNEIPREDVDATVRSAFERYEVVAFRADVKEFEAYVDQWGTDFRKTLKVNASPNNPVSFDMRGQQKRFALDCERFVDAVIEREIFHDNNPVLRQHVLNARRHPTIYDAISIRKQSKDSSKKIDAAVCAVLAFWRATGLPNEQKEPRRRGSDHTMTTLLPDAPYGYLWTGQPANSLEECRDNMINWFYTKESELRDHRDYYESKRRPDAIGLAVPEEMKKLLSHVGYPRLYVDAISERLEVEGFRLGGADDQDDELWDWWQANDLDIESPLGHTDALVYGRSYITISAPDPDVDLNWDPTVPIIRVEPPSHLYAMIDHRTRKVMQAIRVVKETDTSRFQGQAATLYLPNLTIGWVRNNTGWDVFQDNEHNLGVVPVVPVTNRISMGDIYGTSQITPEIRAVTDAASRILMDMQAAAELMAVPQRLLFGVKPQDIGVDPSTGESSFDVRLAKVLAFADPEGKAFQYAAAELRNFGDALDQLDRKAAAYTGLPPQYLSVTSDNPASAEAIEASESRFVKACERKNLLFGGSWEQAMRIAYAVMNGGLKSLPPEYNRMESIWRDPSTPTYAAKAAAATQLFAGGAGVIPKKRARLDMGYSLVEIEEMEKWDEQDNPMGLLGSVIGAGAPGAPAGTARSIAATPTKTTDQTPPS